MKGKLYLILIALFATHICFAQDWKTFPYKPSGSLISFPADEGRHPAQPVEWWYTSGHLTGASSGKIYSFMLTYFSYPAGNFDGFRILNLTDDATGAFYQDTKPLHYTKLATDHLDIQAAVYQGGTETWSNKTGVNEKLIPFQYTIKAASALIALDLDCSAQKRPLILGTNGYFKQGLSNYTYYYSLTRNEVAGKLTLNGLTEDVTGTSWIDRQYGTFNPFTGEKYEWFHVQLSNGMDMNLWNIFNNDNAIPENDQYRSLATYVDETSQYTTSDLKIERLRFNWMPDSTRCYSSKWKITSSKNNIDLTVTTQSDHSEVQLPFRFFEGATTVSGTVNGKDVTGFGFAELLHSYEHPKVKLAEPAQGIYHPSTPVKWQLMNPDDGRMVYYDLSYSVNNKVSFMPVAQNLTDTIYQWPNPTVANGDKIWFKITAHTIDNKLQGIAVSTDAATVSIDEDNLKIKLFPNPVGAKLHLQPAFQSDNPAARIVDANGRLVYSIKSNSISDKIDVSFLAPGIYFLAIDFPGKKNALKFIKK
ncbi:MAG TPA: lipocalin-like domain-containing protein [Hanamia sp.]|nr:lipocalin-like domain-containing protein [Hanamia sp.]